MIHKLALRVRVMWARHLRHTDPARLQARVFARLEHDLGQPFNWQPGAHLHTIPTDSREQAHG